MPQRLDDMIGRGAELQHVLELLAAHPVVTLTGVPGVGKTHLAFEALRQWQANDDRGDHVICDLTQCTQEGLVEATIAGALGLTSLDLLAAHPRGPTLLLLDNCEHLVEPVVRAIDRILSTSAPVSILATSREALGLVHEQVVPLKPLEVRAGSSLDAAQASPAVRLLLDRARERGAELELDQDSAAILLKLCRRLDGLPLAIELAASRMRSMTAEELLARLDDRLRILVRRKPHGPERHRALYAAIESSYQMISPIEQHVLERLGVFRGEFGNEAVGFICEDLSLDGEQLLDALDGLVDRSLVVARARAGATRYLLLESLREFALSKLEERGERKRVEQRFVRYMVERCRAAIKQLSSEWPAQTVAALSKDFSNLQAAFHYCLTQDTDPDGALVLVAATTVCVHEGHAAEIAAMAEHAVQRWPDVEHEYSNLVYAAMASAYMVSGAVDKVFDAAWAGLLNRGSSQGAIHCRRALAISQLYEGQIARAASWIEEALEQSDPDSPAACDILIQKARVLGFGQGPELGLPHAAQARELAERLKSPHLIAASEQMLGWLNLMGAPAIARAHFERSLTTSRRLGFLSVLASSLLGLGSVSAFSGDKADAAARFLEALETWEEAEDRPQVWGTIRWSAFWLAQWGLKPEAARLFGALDASLATPMLTPLERAFFAQVEANLRDGLGELDMARAEGAGWTLREALQLTRARLRELIRGADAVEAPAPATAEAPSNGSHSGVFRREGELWKLSFDGKTAELPDLKGLNDLAMLLSQPETEVHCLQLAGRRAETSGFVLDARARREYEERIQALQEELLEAEAHNDFGRAEKAGAELDALTEQLSSAFGVGGRPRELGNATERSRSTVTWRIRSAIKKIRGTHETLAKHLQASVQTGTYLVYSPPVPVSWQL